VSGLAFESHAAAMDTLPPGCPLYAHNPSQTGNGCADGSVVVIVVDSVGGEGSGELHCARAVEPKAKCPRRWRQ
jgi:hypothetical protein